ncbi:hypothetical protein [Tolypothrix sp. VBCCA 56010]|uniref:hypothetical protein n=1 Tax=Tolypothrix sp. VBCCA 56010 TaxID=3137731 RepID=UPI003D7EEC97
MHARRFWQSMLSVTAATILIGQQILVKTAVAQAQDNLNGIPILSPPYPPVTAATWEGYTETNFESVFPDGETACNSFKTLFDVPVTLEGTKLEYFEAGGREGEVHQNRCYLKALIDGQYFNYEKYASRVNCPIIGLPERYIYTGGTNGKCILTSILEWDPILQASYSGKPLEGTNVTNQTWIPLITSLGLEEAVKAVAGLIILGAYVKEYPPQFLSESSEEKQQPKEEDLAKPWGGLIKDATKTSKPNAPEDVWDKPGQPGLDEANKDFDSLNPSGVKDIDTSYGRGRQGTLPNDTSVSVRPGSSSSSNNRPTIQINPPRGQGKPQKIRY